MNKAPKAHPEQYEDFNVGDDVFCLAWVGMPFRVVKKDDETQRISVDGQGPCSLPDGTLIDIDPSTMFMLTHNVWDTLWTWPDREGETYKQVVDRFVGAYSHGDIVTGYLGSFMLDKYYIDPDPELAMSFELDYGALDVWHLVGAQPVAAINGAGEGLVRTYDPAIPLERWIKSGPAMPLRLEMVAYRWALLYGRIILNWPDFTLGE